MEVTFRFLARETVDAIHGDRKHSGRAHKSGFEHKVKMALWHIKKGTE